MSEPVNPFPLNISDKEDSFEKLQLMANVPDNKKFLSGDFNKLRDAMTYIKWYLDQLMGTAAYLGGLSISDEPSDEIGFYFAKESGTYTNAGNIVVDLTAGLTVLAYDGTTWTDVVIPIDLAIITQLSDDFEAIINRTPSPNLFDTTAIQEGSYLSSSNGGVTGGGAATGWSCSDWIPVVAGQQYTLSGSRGRNGLSFFSSYGNLVAISGSYNGASSLPLTVTAPAGANFIVFNLESASSPGFSNIQFEEGNSATTYTPFGDIISLDIEVENFISKKTDLQKRTIGKNLFDYTQVAQNALILSNGAIGGSAGFVLSGKIQCLPSLPYTVSGVDATSKRISVRDINDNVLQTFTYAANPYSFTTHADADHFYVTVKRSTDIIDIQDVQIEQSAEATSFEAYKWAVLEIIEKILIAQKVLINNEVVSTDNLLQKTGDLSVYFKEDGLQWFVRIPFNETYDLFHLWQFDPNNLQPEFKNVLKLVKSTQNNDGVFTSNQAIHSCADDICPIRLQQTGVIGGGHGLSSRRVNLAAHGKTEDDLTSEWTDGTYNWYLVEIPDVNTLNFIGKRFSFGGGDAVPNAFASATLTHVSGATNTANINVSSVATEELFPAVKDLTYKFVLDGVEISPSGLHIGNDFKIIDNHKIIDPREVTIQAPFVSNEGGDLLENTITYSYDKTNTCYIDHTLNFLTDYFITHFGFTQSQRAITSVESAGVTLLYIPNTGLINDGSDDYNLATTPVNIFNSPFAGNLIYGEENIPDNTKSVNRVIELQQTAGGVKKNGYAQTFSFEKGITKNDNRKLLTEQWEIRGSSSKSYPRGIDAYSADGEVLQGKVQRTYYDASVNPDFTAVYAYKDVDGYYLFIDSHETLTKQKVIVPNYLKNKSIEIAETGGDFTLHTDSFIPESCELIVSIDTYGYIVLKLT